MVAACGEVAGETVDAAVDAPIDMGIDMSTARCNPSAPFGAPVALGGVNSTSNDNDGYLSADGLTIYLRSPRAGGPGVEDIWFATRTSTSATFGTPMPVPTINSAQYEEGPVVSADGLSIYFSSSRTGGTGQHDIYVATRASTAGAFGPPDRLLNVQSQANEVPSHINAAGTRLYFYSDRDGDYNVFVASRASATASFAAPVAIGALNGIDAESTLILTGDELTAYFTSNRTGGTGSSDVWRATRSTLGDGFGAATPVTELNSTAGDAPTWISPDDCDIVTMSDRAGGVGAFDIYVASRPAL